MSPRSESSPVRLPAFDHGRIPPSRASSERIPAGRPDSHDVPRSRDALGGRPLPNVAGELADVARLCPMVVRVGGQVGPSRILVAHDRAARVGERLHQVELVVEDRHRRDDVGDQVVVGQRLVRLGDLLGERTLEQAICLDDGERVRSRRGGWAGAGERVAEIGRDPSGRGGPAPPVVAPTGATMPVSRWKSAADCWYSSWSPTRCPNSCGMVSCGAGSAT